MEVGHVYHFGWKADGMSLLQNHVTCTDSSLGIATFMYGVPVDPLEFIVLQSSVDVRMWVG